MPTLLSLPTELIDKIITTTARSEDNGDSYPDPKLVSTCSLLCKTFYRVARELQFNAVIRTLTEKDAQIFPELLAYQHKDPSLPPLVDYVQSLDLKFDIVGHVFDECYVHYLDAFLAPFSGDACRIRFFAFRAEKDQDETEVIYPETFSWHELLPSTQRTFSNIFQSSSLDTVDIHGVLNVPFRLLRSMTPNVKSLSLTSTSVVIGPDDLDESKAPISPPLLALEQLYIGGLEIKMAKPPVPAPTETNEPDDAGVAFDVALSRLIDLSKLDTLIVLKGYQDALIEGPIPSLEGVFARCSNLRGFHAEFDSCAELYPLFLDRIPSSVAWVELYGFSSLPFESNFDDGPDNYAMFSNIDEPALFPTGIASASSANPQLPDVTITLQIFVRQRRSPQIDRLMLADGVTPYWDALLENLRTITASRIRLNMRIGYNVDYGSSRLDNPRPRPDERIEEEVNRVFGEYNANNPDKPINVEYSCTIQF